jgi:hypothetical protein
MKLAPGWWRLSVMIPMAVVIGIGSASGDA